MIDLEKLQYEPVELKMERWQLKQLQSLPLKIKIEKTKRRIIEWYEYWQGNVYISFSGGKDSTVLLHLVRSIYPNIEAVYCDTGLEYPELKQFVKTIDNVRTIKPKVNFRDVLKKYGIPIISKEMSGKIFQIKNYNLSDSYKNKLLYGDEKGTMGMISKKWQFLIYEDIQISDKCCYVMKKEPFKRYEKETNNKPIIGTMACESKLRESNYLTHGCNSFSENREKSTPLGFWTEQDILQYILDNNLEIPSVYGEIIKIDGLLKTTGCYRTGCIFCCYGVHLEKYPNRFQKLETTHPQLHNYCINKLNLKYALDLIGVKYTRPKCNREKYKKETVKISYRIDVDKLNKLMKILNFVKVSELTDYLIKNYKLSEQFEFIKNSKYKIETRKIDVRLDKKQLDRLKTKLKITNNSNLLDYLIDEKLKTVGQIL